MSQAFRLIKVGHTYTTKNGLDVHIFRYRKETGFFEGYLIGHRHEGTIFYLGSGRTIQPKS